MEGILGIYFRVLSGHLHLPMMALVILLNRSPMIKVLVEKHFNLMPRAAHLVKWLAGSSFLVGGVDTLTGATASVQLLAGFNNTTGYVGETFGISFASTAYTVGSYRLGGTAPPGLALSPTVNEFGVGTVDGIPTRAGVYNLDIWAYEEKNHTGDSTLLALTIYILEKGPNISKHPLSASLPWGATLNLSVTLKQAAAATYQWRRNGENIAGANDSTYQVAQASSRDEGLYDVVIVKDEIPVTSNPASIAVMTSGIQVWKETVFPDPYDSSLTYEQADPDRDGLVNLVEFALGTDPLEPSVVQFPTIGRETSILGNYVVYGIQKNPLASGLHFSAQYSDQLVTADWIPVVSLQNGMIVEEDENLFVVKVPQETSCFVRFKISDG